MRILLTANGSPWTRNKGGGTLAVHHLAVALTKLGHEVTVLYGRGPGDPFEPDLSYSVEWARYFDVATINLNIFSFRAKLQHLLNTGHFDLIHGNGAEAFFAPELCRKAGIPFFYTSHANFLPSEHFFEGMLRPIQFLKSVNTYLERGAAQGADLIFTFSEFSKNLVVNALGAFSLEKVHVVYPGVADDWFEVKRKTDIKKQLILWGRMADQKGIPELLEAFKYVRQENKEISLLLVGGGSCQPQYEQLAGELGVCDSVTFVGWKEEKSIREFAAESLIGVFPSRIESFGLAIAEAMATGLPVVATRVGALPEFIEDETTGLLVESGNIEELSRKLLSVISSPDKMEAMGNAAKSSIREKCCWDKAAKAIELKYNQMILSCNEKRQG